MKAQSSKEHKLLSPFPRTLSYFFMWGLDYGFIFGFAAGSMLLPAFGTIIGSILGLVIGGLYGVIVGLGMSATYRGIAPETDLDTYGQTLVRRTAGLLTLFNLSGLPLVLTFLYRHLLTQFPAYYRTSNETNISLAMLPIGALCIVISFVVAATARHYPHWMAHERPLNAPLAHAFLMRHEMETAFQQIRRRTARWWLPLLTFSLISLVYLMNPVEYAFHTSNEWLEVLGIGVFFSFVGLWAGRIYLSLVNAAVLTFIKRVILRDYFPNLTGARYRTRVTLIAFSATMLATWWTLFFSPVIALLMAFFVYHTVALPDEMQEKSKRKEADVSKSKVPSALMLPEETDGEIVDLNRHRLADPSSLQAQQSE